MNSYVEDRRRQIKEILARGNIAVFRNVITGVVKKVSEWNLDSCGDLIADTSTGLCVYVCWESDQYEIEEEEHVIEEE